MIALTETWPKRHGKHQQVDPRWIQLRSDRRGGEVGVLYKSCINMILSRPWPAKPFQCLKMVFVYHQVLSGHYSFIDIHLWGLSFKTFMVEFTNLLEMFAAQFTGLIILNNFNIHYGKAGNKDSNNFCDLLHATNLQQHIRDPTHAIGNILISSSSGRQQWWWVYAYQSSCRPVATVWRLLERIVRQQASTLTLAQLSSFLSYCASTGHQFSYFTITGPLVWFCWRACNFSNVPTHWACGYKTLMWRPGQWNYHTLSENLGKQSGNGDKAADSSRRLHWTA